MGAETKRWRGRLAGVILVGLTLAVFWPATGHDFINWDDNLNVYENPRFLPVTWAGVVQFWREAYYSLYIPLTYTAWAVQAKLAALPPGTVSRTPFNPRVFHTTNLLLHVVNVLLVFSILRTVAGLRASRQAPQREAKATRSRFVQQSAPGTRPFWSAAGGALLFALHPLQVEPVSWVTGLKDVLSGTLMLAAIRLYLGFLARAVRALPDDRGGAGGEGERGWVRAVPAFALPATVAFVMALAAKPTAVATPLIAAVLSGYVLYEAGKGIARRGWVPAAVCVTVWLLLAGLWAGLTVRLQPASASGVRVDLAARPLVAADALAFYVGRLLAPIRLAPDYGRTPASVAGTSRAYLSLLFVCGVGVLLWLGRRRYPFAWLAAGVWVAGLLPVLGLVPFAFQLYSTVADRYMYVAMLGPALAVAGLLSRARVQRGWGLAARVAAILCLGGLGVAAGRQVRVWRDGPSLFEHALAVNPDSWVLNNNYGLVLAAAGRTDEAIARYRKSLQVYPRYEYAHNNLGLCLADKGQLDKAMAHYRQAVAINPAYADAHNNLGLALAGLGRPAEAVREYREALRIKPTFIDARNNLGVALVAQGRPEDAIREYRAVLRQAPSVVATHVNLGVALADTGRTEEAAASYSAAIRLFPDSFEAHFNLGNLLARQTRYAEAIPHFSAAARVRPDSEPARRNLALARERLSGAGEPAARRKPN
ncbi:MAG: tetratricopeptide repeat protein [Kiritimatiellae bacterium]|nr:tetratricopeptide repeat protein [Kiritimatiellia bacterium]